MARENALLFAGMAELRALDPTVAALGRLPAYTGVDSAERVAALGGAFQRTQAEALRLVASCDEYIQEVADGRKREFPMHYGIDLNLKVRVTERSAPLHMTFSYTGASAAKSIRLYYSFTAKEPGEERHAFAATLRDCSTLVRVPGQVDAKTGKEGFSAPWVYFTLRWAQDSEGTVGVCAKFPAERTGGKRGGRGGDHGGGWGGRGDGADDHDEHADEEICATHFTMGGGGLPSKKGKVERFVKKLMVDDP